MKYNSQEIIICKNPECGHKIIYDKNKSNIKYLNDCVIEKLKKYGTWFD